jgi:hypothetical protein
MKKGDEVYISWQDISACGYGDSVNTSGIIISDEDSEGRFWVKYKEDEYPYFMVENQFHRHDLTIIH